MSREQSPKDLNHEKPIQDDSQPLKKARIEKSNPLKETLEYKQLQTDRKQLPIYEQKDMIVKTLKENQCVVLTAETGSGKTTQIGQYLLEDGSFTQNGKIIGVTQPRRVAAVSVARRVSQEMGVELGDEVGYAIRFSQQTSEKTKIKYMTDGVLLGEILRDSNLDQYSVIVLDEAHERSLNTDILFGLLRETMIRRPDLKVFVTSATLNIEKFSAYFNDCPVMTVPGRSYPVVEIFQPDGPQSKLPSQQLLRPNYDYVAASVQAALDVHIEQPAGDVLVFLTGQEEIERAVIDLQTRIQQMYDDEPNFFKSLSQPDIRVLPLYASLPPEKQVLVFRPTSKTCRKVVFATNVAETSLTIDGIAFVIDPGFHKCLNFDAKSGIESLDIEPISRVAAEQRKGRAGRTKQGVCIRLYTKNQLKTMKQTSAPELQRVSFGRALLVLKAAGVDDVLAFKLVDAPKPTAVITAAKQLHCLGALTEDGKLTSLGKQMSRLPLEPRLARAALEACELGVVDECVSVIALLAADNVFMRPGKSHDREEADDVRKQLAKAAEKEYGIGDHLTLLYLYEEWKYNGCSRKWCERRFVNHRRLMEAKSIRNQVLQTLPKQNTKKPQDASKTASLVLKSLCAGYFYQSVKRAHSNVFHHQNQSATNCFIHPSSSLISQQDELLWVIFHTMMFTSKAYMRQVSPVRWSWLEASYHRMIALDDPIKLKQLIGPSYHSNYDKSSNPDVASVSTLESNKTSNQTGINQSVLSKRNTGAAVDDARARYLARKAEKAQKNKKK